LTKEVTLVLDPRFPGGTSSAVARELYALSGIARVRVVAISSNMFKGAADNPKLTSVFEELGIIPEVDPVVVTSDTIVLHNPSFLKFNNSLSTRFVCNRMIAVSHENFLRPNGSPGFDVDKCLSLISKNTLARSHLIAPVSGYNRGTVERWLDASDTPWKLAEVDWFNICDFETLAPNPKPADRRGRLSRAGFEKFPDVETMNMLFPPHAEYCGILGADSFLIGGDAPSHWDLYRFQEIPIEPFLDRIDFFVYFTHPGLQESFGRVIPEAVAAGKLVITDSLTAKTFGSAVISAQPNEVDAIIAYYIAHPRSYVDHVQKAQVAITRFSAAQFSTSIDDFLSKPLEATIDFM